MPDARPGTALICGISGQDGAWLSKLLLDRGYVVVGTSRDAAVGSFGSLVKLGIRERVRVTSATLTDFRSLIRVLLDVQPDEIYNFSGQTSVGLSFEQPAEALESIAVATLNMLEAIRMLKRPVRYYNACSSECFGDTLEVAADEDTPFQPRSPYGVAKAAAFWQVSSYREAYGLYACSGILFNHESPLRPERFVTKKVVAAACRIAAGSRERLKLGDLTVRRDWGWAPEYVDAMWRMLQAKQPEDHIICTGETNPLSAFVDEAFATVGLKAADHVDQDPAFFRPADLRSSIGNPAKAWERLGWKAKFKMRDVVRAMIHAELNHD
ncbi:MAG TPA: GDP-mannose 4,6-dehydratase [Polyangia bacterium]|nr:GDP-mannose 4,6-dehydratase [Polyangia bacterium]